MYLEIAEATEASLPAVRKSVNGCTLRSVHAKSHDVEDGTDSERAQNADRHITLGIFGFLCCGGDGVKADKAKNTTRSSRGYPDPP